MSNLMKLDWNREQIETIKQTVAKGANDSQLALFLQVCKSRGLDPFLKQVYYTPQGIITSIDGFRAIAERTGCYAPGPTRFEYDENKNLLAAYVTVKKLVAGMWHEVEESAFIEEYRGTSPIWRKMPRVMLAKCAESRALRRAFSSDLSGLLTQEEMDQAGVPQVEVSAPQAYVAPTVTVLPPEDAEPTRSPEFAGAANAIADARDLNALKAAAGLVVSAKGKLSADEHTALRNLYDTKRRLLSGGAK